MNIKIVSVGKIKEKYIKEGISEFEKRLKPYCKFSIVEVNDEKTSENMTEVEKNIVKDKEGERILSKISDDEYLIVTAIEGELFSSEEIAKKINSLGVNR